MLDMAHDAALEGKARVDRRGAALAPAVEAVRVFAGRIAAAPRAVGRYFDWMTARPVSTKRIVAVAPVRSSS